MVLDLMLVGLAYPTQKGIYNFGIDPSNQQLVDQNFAISLLRSTTAATRDSPVVQGYTHRSSKDIPFQARNLSDVFCDYHTA